MANATELTSRPIPWSMDMQVSNPAVSASVELLTLKDLGSWPIPWSMDMQLSNPAVSASLSQGAGHACYSCMCLSVCPKTSSTFLWVVFTSTGCVVEEYSSCGATHA